MRPLRPSSPAPALAVALFACIATAGAIPARADPVAAPPAAHDLMIGALRVTALRDALNAVPNDGKVFGKNVGPAVVGDALRAAGAPTDTITLGADALLVRLPGHVVLIDTGFGQAAGGVLLRSLAQAGVTPDQVTDVLLTHSHGDHSGGLLLADGTLAFPRAMIRMSAPEWQSLSAMPARKALVDAIAPRVQPFQPGARVLAGITAVALPGHTPGHSGYRIQSRGQTLLDIGDTAHSALLSLGHPDWVIGYDGDPVAGRSQRERTLARLARDHERVFAPHFPFPGTGTIARAGGGYRWQPDRQ